MKGEIWKDVPGYEGLYKVSNTGRVKSVARKITTSAGWEKSIKEIILKSKPRKCGYPRVVLYMCNTPTHYDVHQLVAMAFLGHRPNKYTLVVNHKNFNKEDNRLENLELVSNRENSNQKHIQSSSVYTGVYKPRDRKKMEGVHLL